MSMKQKARLPCWIDSVHKLCVLCKKNSIHMTLCLCRYMIYSIVYLQYFGDAGKTQYVKGALWDLGIVIRRSLYRNNYSGWGICYYIYIYIYVYIYIYHYNIQWHLHQQVPPLPPTVFCEKWPPHSWYLPPTEPSRGAPQIASSRGFLSSSHLNQRKKKHHG